LDIEIRNEKQIVKDLQTKESILTVQIKFLQTIREKMARTASQASAQAKETR